MKSWRVASFACMLGTLATLGWMAPAPAAADSVGTDAAIGAAVGTIIGQLLFDNNRRQYYYVHERRRCYVSDEQARQYRRNHWREAEYNRDRGGYVDYSSQRAWERRRDWEIRREGNAVGDRGWVGGEERRDRDHVDRDRNDREHHDHDHDRWDRR